MNNIERYLRNELTPEEKIQFEANVRNDNDLRQELESQAAIFASFDQIRRENILSRFNKQKAKVQEMPQPKVMGYWRYAAAIAGIVLIGSTYFFNKPVDLQVLSDGYYSSYPNVVAPSVRSGNNGDVIWAAYNSKDFIEAYIQLELAHNADPENADFSFYLGISAIETGKYDEAIDLFKSLQTGDHKFINQSDWFLAMTYLKIDDKQSAIAVLNVIVESKSSYSDKADRILSELN